VSALSRRELTAFRKSEVGFVFQLYNLVEGLTVYENVNVVSGLVSDPADAAELLEAVGLSELSRQFPAQLSGGQMQRVAIARALCKNPDLILCDEPTGALDSSAGKDVLRLLVRMSRAERKTVLVVTHNPAIALVADRVVRLHDGKVASVELVESPQSVEDVEL
jgi:putative ABC transport system ATP-binding protein